MKNIPEEPYMFLSFVNTQLRDNYSSLQDFADNYGLKTRDILKKLRAIDYHYNATLNRFV